MEKELHELHREFLTAWPIERVKNMTLNEYTNLNRRDSFCYWLEKKTEKLGSIWGGSAFKFGIYEKNQKKKNYNKGGRLSDEQYAWYEKYGSSAAEAFGTIKKIILSIIEAVQNKNYEEIEKIDLGDVVKWKIAFLYSNFELLNIFTKQKLQEIVKDLNLQVDNKNSFYQLQKAILGQRKAEEGPYEFGKRMWEMEKEEKTKRVWLYAPGRGAEKWEEFFQEGIMGLGWDEIGDLDQYESKEEIRDALIKSDDRGGSRNNDTIANVEFKNEVTIGDLIIVKKGRGSLLGYGYVTSDYYYDEDRLDYQKCRKVDWKLKGEWDAGHSLALKTLTEITRYKTKETLYNTYAERLMGIMNGGPKRKESSEYQKEIDLLKYKKQIILQGPPGTGKTRMAKLMAESMLDIFDKALDGSEQFKLIQFHPSYTYEDFVRGIVSKPDENGTGILYEAENKTLGAFAERALRNYRNSFKQEDKEQIADKLLKEFIDKVIECLDEEGRYMISDTIYIFYVDDKRFKYKGDNWKAHPNGLNMNFSELRKILKLGLESRQEINKSDALKALTRQHATYFNNVVTDINKGKGKLQKGSKEVLKNFILIIDEINRANLSSVLGELIYALEYREKAVESMYAIDDSNELILPPNLYIIGTMNTADRSVGHIDYAIRRRFAFIDVLPRDISDQKEIIFHKELFDRVKKLFTEDEGYTYQVPSKYLSEEFNPKDVALGHSYFIDQTENEASMQMRLDYEIKPILREYVNDGVLVGEEVLAIIENLKA